MPERQEFGPRHLYLGFIIDSYIGNIDYGTWDFFRLSSLPRGDCLPGSPPYHPPTAPTHRHFITQTNNP